MLNSLKSTMFVIFSFFPILFGLQEAPAHGAEPKTPAVGDKAADFELPGLKGKNVSLAGLVKEGPVVVLVLRGYPGYQCPLCTAQLGQFISQSKKFGEAKANILLVYPGPATDLKERAAEFMKGTKLPANFQLVLDPDFGFTSAYQLRWDAQNETAYPSTFVIGTDQKIKFAKISKEHGGRSTPDEVLKALESP